jgi:uncharacterized membrane protein YccC
MATPPPPAPVGRGLRAMFEVRAAPRRWPRAVRAATCMGVPVLVGWLSGDLGAGLMATLGGFTALYGSGRPYLNRAALLAVVAVSLSISVGLGIWMASITWVGVLTVAAIATAATLLCNALEVGPPGAYQFALVCAAGTGLHASGHQDPIRSALLVLAGGSFAWLMHMASLVFGPRGPEKSAVAAGGLAVADYVDAIATPGEDAARNHAAQAMHEAWKNLISRQPRRLPPTAAVRRLQELTRRLHMIFADAMGAADTETGPDPEAAANARMLAGQAFDRTGTGGAPTPIDQLPLGRPGAWALIKLSTQGSRSLLVVFRVAVATVVAGALAGLLGLDHAYWAMTAAVLVLHQGLDRRRTTQRALERFVGTWAGLLLAAAVIATHPHALWLVAAIMTLNFLVELTVVRNYTLAVVFITAVALVISTGAHGTSDLGALLLARGVDTAVGCAVGMAVFLLLVPPSVTGWLPTAIADTLEAVGTTAEFMASGSVTTAAAKAARRDLQRCSLRLAQMFDNAINGSANQRRSAEHVWPGIAATQRLAYRTVAECWRLERDAKPDGLESSSAAEYFAHLQLAVRAAAAAVRAGEPPPPVTITPGALSDELRGVHDALHQA